jgi:hypothetical protein
MSFVAECPWCGSKELTWHIPAYSSRLIPACDDCGAASSPITVPAQMRGDQDALNALALKQWNARI